jgi:hypothetical protein
MARRRTIGKDPLADLSPELGGVAAAPAAVAAAAIVPPPRPPSEDGPSAPGRDETVRVPEGEGRRAVGGKLEMFGGRLGSGTVIIWRFGPSARIGFIAPNGRLIDLAGEIEGVTAWPDRGDHRIASAAGWGWVLGSLAGVLGLVAGAGFRLLIPHRMMARVRLRDGGEFLARTDSATVGALEALARARALHRTASRVA